MSRDGQGAKRRRKIAEICNRLSRVHERYRQTTDRQTIDGQATANNEREREFMFANNMADFIAPFIGFKNTTSVLGKIALPGHTGGAYNTELQNLYSGRSH